MSKQSKKELTEIFQNTVGVIDKSLDKKAFSQRDAIMAAVFDAVMVGIARRLTLGPITDFEMLEKHHNTLLSDNKFILATDTHTSDKDKVLDRLQISIKLFSDVK